RGVHLTRLEGPRKKAVKKTLAPAVCLHCKDPECLTGCPTGAIGRFDLGQIDIDSKSCIGCGDCATNCPYDAISMAPRETVAPARGSSEPRDSERSWRRWLRIAPDPPPEAVKQTDGLLAVKCNLCSGSALNPAGAKTQKYGCEENCPTGALARVN